MYSVRSLAFNCLLLIIVLASSMVAQPDCPVPPAVHPVPPGADLFSDAQEVDLGDAMAEALGSRIQLVHDDKLNLYLQGLGDRVAGHLPPTQLRFRFYLVELPEANAFGIAGGRVYVARKMIALAKTEDELAGVLAHELGHIVTHQAAIEMTTRMRDVLGVTQIGDRADVFERFHQLLENEGRKPAPRDHGESGQYVADQVALYAMARAGYAPHAYVDLWDRYQETHGKTGNWLTDVFGSTKPSQRRLREMLKNVSAMPAGCADISAPTQTAEFAKWQAEVVAYAGKSEESLPGLILKQTLSRPLRPDVSNLRFSPDGKYVLAQDEGGIHILSRNPFTVLFFIPAVNARDASFSPDSQSVVFHNQALRVESWSIQEQKRNWVRELTLLHPCVQTELSSDGSTLACLNLQLELSLIDVTSGTPLTVKKSFLQLTSYGYCLEAMSMMEGEELRLIAMRFSPDARYFLAGSNIAHLGWDVANRRELPLPGSLKEAVKDNFTFVGTSRVVGINMSAPEKSVVLDFPSGQRVAQIPLARNLKFKPVTHGDYLLIGPLRSDPLGIVDVKEGSIRVTLKKPACDVYDGTFVTERNSGELALHSIGSNGTISTTRLPQGRLGPLQAISVSPDFRWLFLSNRRRGGIWDLTHDLQTMEVRGFRGVWFAPDQMAYADFPKRGDAERQIFRLEPSMGIATPAYKVGDIIAEQHGPYLLFSKPSTGETAKKHKQRSIELDSPELVCLRLMLSRFYSVGRNTATDQDVEVRDVRDGHEIWTRHFPEEVPSFSFSQGAVLLSWPLSEAGGRDELSKFPELKSGLDTADYFLEQVDLKSNAVLAKFVLSTNSKSFLLTHAFAEGDWVIASATENQVFSYALPDGQRKGHFFGSRPSASRNGLLAIEAGEGHINVYDLATSKLKHQYTFSDPIAFKTFSTDGTRLFVMGVTQTAYVLDLTAGK